MNYLKSLFPICDTLSNHLRRHNSLTEAEIVECTKSFPYTILVCDKVEPSAPFNTGSTPCQFSFNEILLFAEDKRNRRGQLFVNEYLKIAPWFRLHAVVGDSLLRYFFEQAYLFRALDGSDFPNFVIQITGLPIFGNGYGKRNNSTNGSKNSKARKRQKKSNTEQNRESGLNEWDQIDAVADTGAKKKKHRRGKSKKRKISATLPNGLLLATFPKTSRADQASTTHPQPLAASALRISAKSFLYCFDLRERFVGAKHPIVIEAKTRQFLGRELLERTFGFLQDDPILAGAGRSINALIPLLSRWIKLHKRHTCFSSYLNIFCPIDNSLLSDATKDDDRLSELVQGHCPKFRVKRALEAIFFHILPMELFGEDNTTTLLNSLIQFVIGAGRFDVISLHQLASCVKTSKCVWLTGFESSELRQHFLLRVLNLVVRYLLRVVSSCFYVTESQSDKHQLFFYRKPIWKRISRLAGAQFIVRCRLNPINIDPDDQSSYYGPFALRWIPKSGGEVRPIVCAQHGRKRIVGRAKCGDSVKAMNLELQPILAIAQYLVRQKHVILGHATSDSKNIHLRWSSFVHRARQKCPDSIQHYIVKADVTRCFDSIDQQLLWHLIEEQLLQDAPDNFSLESHYVIRAPTAGSASSVFAFRKQRFAVRPLGKCESLARYYASMQKNSRSGNKPSRHKGGTLVVPKGRNLFITKQEVIGKLHQLIFRRILTVNRRRYRQTVGISQGSSLSILLCNLYLAALEKKYLDPMIVETEDLLMRHVDDFLYVTPSLDRAKKFAQMVSTGFEDFNARFKPEKTVTNVEWQIPDSDEIAVIMSCNDRPCKNQIPWCGLLFDANTLDVSIDSSRWPAKNARNSIVVDYSKYPPSYVVQKLFCYLRARFPEILFDKSTNSNFCVRRNLKVAIKITSSWYSAYVSAYEFSRVVDPCAKRRLRDANFIEELVKRIYDALVRRSGDSSKMVFRQSLVRNLFMHALKSV